MNSALIIRGGAIGDFILTLPSLHVFRERHPEVRLEILGYPHIVELARNRFYAQAVRSIDQRAAAGFFAKDGALDPDLSLYIRSFDLVVSYLYDPDRIFIDNLKKAGANRVVAVDGRPMGPGHASEYLAQWLKEIGLPFPIGSPRLYPSAEDHQEAHRLFSKSKNPRVALHLGSGSRSKNWPVTRFLELCAWLQSQGCDVVAMDGPADSEAQSQFWSDPASRGCARCHGMALPQVAAMLQRCAAFVGHDSGMTHLCAAVDVPTIAIFGPTDPKLWGPRGKSVAILRGGPRTTDVAVDEVKAAVARILFKRE